MESRPSQKNEGHPAPAACALHSGHIPVLANLDPLFRLGNSKFLNVLVSIRIDNAPIVTQERFLGKSWRVRLQYERKLRILFAVCVAPTESDRSV